MQVMKKCRLNYIKRKISSRFLGVLFNRKIVNGHELVNYEHGDAEALKEDDDMLANGGLKFLRITFIHHLLKNGVV
jgi:hypothetical protein